jgi:hypothetical protein
MAAYRFKLKNNLTNEYFGEMSFNGKFIFKLDPNVNFATWDRTGLLPVNENTRELESDDLFFYINSRLPIELRNSDKEKKLEYIRESGLKVASDNYYFEFVPGS